jgi:hypothetical protein
MAAKKTVHRPLNAGQLDEALDALRLLCGIAKAQIEKAGHDLDVAAAGIESLQEDIRAHGFSGSNGGAS